MPDGFGRGRGFGRGYGGGMGFGFRGASPPRPYVGIGRGGLPRCGYYFGGAVAPPPWPYQPLYYGPEAAYPAYAPYPQPMSREEELDYLKDEAQAVKEQLERIDSRINSLESEGKEEE